VTRLTNYDIIIAPVVTEKSTRALEKNNQVVFEVRREATKPEIKAAVEGLFNVKVKAVNTLIRKGKLKAFRGRRAILGDVKQAIVTLEAGQSIDTSGV
jgi:large subunit ribosomal protein L23